MIMTETLATFPDPEILAIVIDTRSKHPKTVSKMTYVEKKNINEAICPKLRNGDEYETDIHKIYNIILVYNN